MRRDDIDIDDAIEQMSAQSLICRDLMHSWRPHTAWKIDGGFERTLRCIVCETERVEVLNSFGEVLRRHYSYADGYLVPGTGRLDAADRGKIRLAGILRTAKKKRKGDK